MDHETDVEEPEGMGLEGRVSHSSPEALMESVEKDVMKIKKLEGLQKAKHGNTQKIRNTQKE